MTFEQINNSTGTVTYLHHDQAGSTRLLTGSTGTVTGKCSYAAYGTPTCEGTATTPLGFDSEYTSSDTGLVYLRNRVYDPATSQFLTVDPLKKLTRTPYNYAGDNPQNEGDPTGEGAILEEIGTALFPGGGSKQACVGGNLALWFAPVTVSLDVCYVQTPGGESITLAPGATIGPGAGASIHYDAGESTACRPSEYNGLFEQAGGSASLGLVGGCYSRFSNKGLSRRTVKGWNAGGSIGLNAEAGVGGSYTFTPIAISGESIGTNSGCGC